MNRLGYDLFERLPDGSPLWHGHISDLKNVHERLREIARATANECFAIQLSTREVVERINDINRSGLKF